MSEAQFILRRGDIAAASFHERLREIARKAANKGLAWELATAVPSEALLGLAHAAETAGQDSVDAVLSLRGESGALVEAADALAAPLDAACDAATSSVLGVRRHAILPGVDGIRLFFGLRRLPRLSRAAFQDYWLNVHADYGRRLIPPYYYHQLHADERATRLLAEASQLPASTLDGVADVYFPDLAAFTAQLSRPDVAADALADERNFIDHSRSVFSVFAVE